MPIQRFVGEGVVEEGIPDGATGDPILLEGKTAAVAIFPEGTAKLQFTISRPVKIGNGTARWLDWSQGNVTAPASDVIDGPITAVRGVSISGDLVIEVSMS